MQIRQIKSNQRNFKQKFINSKLVLNLQINLRDRDGLTPLHYCVLSDRLDVIVQTSIQSFKLLLDYNANPFYEDKCGLNVLHYCCISVQVYSNLKIKFWKTLTNICTYSSLNIYVIKEQLHTKIGSDYSQWQGSLYDPANTTGLAIIDKIIVNSY